jgi:hypothetical protein
MLAKAGAEAFERVEVTLMEGDAAEAYERIAGVATRGSVRGRERRMDMDMLG